MAVENFARMIALTANNLYVKNKAEVGSVFAVTIRMNFDYENSSGDTYSRNGNLSLAIVSEIEGFRVYAAFTTKYVNDFKDLTWQCISEGVTFNADESILKTLCKTYETIHRAAAEALSHKGLAKPADVVLQNICIESFSKIFGENDVGRLAVTEINPPLI